jgi:hypothetical protein
MYPGTHGHVPVRLYKQTSERDTNMSAHPKPQPLVGIEVVHDTYFNKPAIRLGTGKETCQLTPNNAKRLLTAVEQNGVDVVVEALRDLVKSVDPNWKPASLFDIKEAKPAGAKLAEDTVTKPQPKATKPAKPAKKSKPASDDDEDIQLSGNDWDDDEIL